MEVQSIYCKFLENSFLIRVDERIHFSNPQVFSRLWFPIVRQGALAVLSHMLLSFQHSPEAFHSVKDLLCAHSSYHALGARFIGFVI